MYKLKIMFLFVFSMSGVNKMLGQHDTFIIGDTIKSTRIKNLNDWQNCRNIKAEELLILDTLKMLNGFYDRLISSYSIDSKCIFYEMWNYELQRSSDVYKNISRNIFKYKPYRENINIDSIEAYALYSHILPFILFDCEYFEYISKGEFEDPHSNFNKTIYLIFDRHKRFLVTELENQLNNCYKVNLKIILKSLDLTNSKK